MTPAAPQDAKVTELLLLCILLSFLFLWLALTPRVFPHSSLSAHPAEGLIIRKAAGLAQFADTEAAVLYSTVISVRPALNDCQATGREAWEVRLASHFGSDCKVNFQVFFHCRWSFFFWGLVGCWNCSCSSSHWPHLEMCKIPPKSSYLLVGIAFF